MDDFIVANNDKSIELISYIVNLNNDVLNMKNVCKQLEIKKNQFYTNWICNPSI